MANKSEEILYAFIGAGDFAIEKVGSIRKVTDRKTTTKLYKDFVKRGRSLSTKVRTSGPTKRAVTQTKTARTQVKAAATSVNKAVRANAKATRSAASKTVQAS